MTQEQLEAFAFKQAKADAIIEAIGDGWAGDVLPTPQHLLTLVEGFFLIQDEGEWFKQSFGRTYWQFLIEGYLRSRRGKQVGLAL